jgi:DNA-binding transcriptional ArsR family regulator
MRSHRPPAPVLLPHIKVIIPLIEVYEDTHMLEAVVGSEGAERVLLFLAARNQGYPLEIAETFDMSVSNVQKHLERMERDGLLVNEKVGRTRVYRLNPRYAFKDEVETLLNKALSVAPEALRDLLLLDRRRPRRRGKPL